MKRFRVLGADFDSRALLLSREIKEDWDEEVKTLHRRNCEQIREGLVAQYGASWAEEKLQNFIDLGPKSWSVIAYHNEFAAQVRDAFVVGAYYPALTAACALAERILNHLVIDLRDDFLSTPEYQRVRGRQSIDNWNLLIRVLASWGVLLPEVVEAFDRLANVRNNALHFNPATDRTARRQALKAITLLDRIIGTQFGILRFQPWFIPNIKGASFIRRDWEDHPFVRAVYLPNCLKLGPYHWMELVNDQWIVHDDYPYEDGEISDDEFQELLESRRLSPTITTS